MGQPCPYCGTLNGPDWPWGHHYLRGSATLCSGCNKVYLVYVSDREVDEPPYRIIEINSKKD